MELMMERLRSTNEVTLDWSGLYKKAPEWFKDAKFGLFFHWGPYSVPEWENEWYSRNIYTKGHTANKHHVETYGPLSDFGYKDFHDQLKGENFNPDIWIDFIERSGAKYAGPVAEHGDGFAMWDSKVNPVNSVNFGIHRDIVGELEAAFRKKNIPFLTSLHHSWLWGWFMSSDPEADVYDPQNEKFYGPILPYSAIQYIPYPMPDDAFCQNWLDKSKEVVIQYKPDMVYFDSRVNIIKESYRKEFIKFYYDFADKNNMDVLVTYKQEDFPEGTAVHDMECSRFAEAPDFYWQTDDKLDWNTWCHVKTPDYKSAKRIIHQLADVVAKNGNLILNVGPKQDGTFPEGAQKILFEVGDWLKAHGEAIYGTRAYKYYGEGTNRFEEPDLNERDIKEFTSKDIRYTKKGNVLYAIMLGWPDNGITLEKLSSQETLPFEDIKQIDLINGKAELKWTRDEAGLSIELPNEYTQSHAYVLKITGTNK